MDRRSQRVKSRTASSINGFSKRVVKIKIKIKKLNSLIQLISQVVILECINNDIFFFQKF